MCKVFITVVLVAALCALLCGCGSSTDNEKDVLLYKVLEGPQGYISSADPTFPGADVRSAYYIEVVVQNAIDEPVTIYMTYKYERVTFTSNTVTMEPSDILAYPLRINVGYGIYNAVKANGIKADDIIFFAKKASEVSVGGEGDASKTEKNFVSLHNEESKWLFGSIPDYYHESTHTTIWWEFDNRNITGAVHVVLEEIGYVQGTENTISTDSSRNTRVTFDYENPSKGFNVTYFGRYIATCYHYTAAEAEVDQSLLNENFFGITPTYFSDPRTQPLQVSYMWGWYDVNKVEELCAFLEAYGYIKSKKYEKSTEVLMCFTRIESSSLGDAFTVEYFDGEGGYYYYHLSAPASDD